MEREKEGQVKKDEGRPEQGRMKDVEWPDEGRGKDEEERRKAG